MTKSQTAALGFLVKSGWAAVVLLSRPLHAFQLSDVSRVELSDPRLPETRQPYHAAMGKLETDLGRLNQREQVVRRIAQQSLVNLLIGYRQKGYAISRAGIVVGSQLDPARITNLHIRAHAMEGRLFRSVVEETLRDHEICVDVLLESDAYARIATRLRESIDDVKRAIQELCRSLSTHAQPWRAEQKLAALAALFALQ